MATFISATDESASNGLFVYGGYSASWSFWDDDFAPAWEEDVLRRGVRIPYLHVADFYRPGWLEKAGMTETQARRKLDEAARIIRCSGQLIPVVFSLRQSDVDSILRQEIKFYPERKQPQLKSLEPDYVCFYLQALEQIRTTSSVFPWAEKIDLWVERKPPLTSHMEAFKSDLARHFPSLGLGELVPLIGDYLAVSKKRIPVQAADYLCWHERHHQLGTLGRDEARRYAQLVDGDVFRNDVGRWGSRPGFKFRIGPESLQEVADSLRRLVEAMQTETVADGAR